MAKVGFDQLLVVFYFNYVSTCGDSKKAQLIATVRMPRKPSFSYFSVAPYLRSAIYSGSVLLPEYYRLHRYISLRGNGPAILLFL